MTAFVSSTDRVITAPVLSMNTSDCTILVRPEHVEHCAGRRVAFLEPRDNLGHLGVARFSTSGVAGQFVAAPSCPLFGAHHLGPHLGAHRHVHLPIRSAFLEHLLLLLAVGAGTVTHFTCCVQGLQRPAHAIHNDAELAAPRSERRAQIDGDFIDRCVEQVIGLATEHGFDTTFAQLGKRRRLCIGMLGHRSDHTRRQRKLRFGFCISNSKLSE